MVKRIIILNLLLLAYCLTTNGQSGCFASVELSRSSVYVQQPFRVTITVYTETWYTAPLSFDNIQIPNSFILSFDRTQSGMYTLNGKQYAGLQFYFIVFPYKAGDFTVPSIKIVATTPPPGQSESRQTTIKTSPHNFKVLDVPDRLKKKGSWFVAKDVYMSESWNKPLNKLKVGDVAERTIVIDAKGTLPQFIPDLPIDSLNWASVYPQGSDMVDTRDENDANGRKTIRFVYLFEKAGDFTLPAIELNWWNPSSSRMYSKSVGAHSLHIDNNPNLGMLTSIRDSLNATKAVTANKQKAPFLILGIHWYWFVLYVLAGLFILWSIARLAIRLYKNIVKRRRLYRESEPYWFRRFIRSQDDKNTLVVKLFNWWDRRRYKNRSSSIGIELRKESETETLNTLKGYYEALYNDDANEQSPSNEAGLKKGIEHFRKELNGKSNEEDKTMPDSQKEWKNGE